MPTVSVPYSRTATRSMWRAEWADDKSISRANGKFLSCLTRFITHGARIEWSGIKSLIRQLSDDAGRTYTQRHVLRLLAWATSRGLIRRARHSAPGRPALYEAVIPDHPGHRHVRIRRRGLRPRRLLAAWRAELATEQAAERVQDAPGATDDTPARDRHRYRSGEPHGA